MDMGGGRYLGTIVVRNIGVWTICLRSLLMQSGPARAWSMIHYFHLKMDYCRLCLSWWLIGSVRVQLMNLVSDTWRPSLPRSGIYLLPGSNKTPGLPLSYPVVCNCTADGMALLQNIRGLHSDLPTISSSLPQAPHLSWHFFLTVIAFDATVSTASCASEPLALQSRHSAETFLLWVPLKASNLSFHLIKAMSPNGICLL